MIGNMRKIILSIIFLFSINCVAQLDYEEVKYVPISKEDVDVRKYGQHFTVVESEIFSVDKLKIYDLIEGHYATVYKLVDFDSNRGDYGEDVELIVSQDELLEFNKGVQVLVKDLKATTEIKKNVGYFLNINEEFQILVIAKSATEWRIQVYPSNEKLSIDELYSFAEQLDKIREEFK